MLPAQPNQSLIDGLACLQRLASQREAVGGRELARELGLEPTRVNRLLKTLAHLGLAEQDPARKYRPGPAIHVLAAQAMFGSGLLQRAAPHLEALRQTGLLVALGVLWGDRVAFLYHATPDTAPGEAVGRVGLFPAHQSGIGMAVFAKQTDAHIEASYTQPDLCRVVLAGAQQARKVGYALVRREDGSATIGIALGDTTQAAIGLAGHFNEAQVPALAVRLQQAASLIRAASAPTTSQPPSALTITSTTKEAPR